MCITVRQILKKSHDENETKNTENNPAFFLGIVTFREKKFALITLKRMFVRNYHIKTSRCNRAFPSFFFEIIDA